MSPGRGCLNWGFGGNWEIMGGDGESFLPPKAGDAQKVGRFGADRNDCAARIGAAGSLAVTGCAKRVRVSDISLFGARRIDQSEH